MAVSRFAKARRALPGSFGITFRTRFNGRTMSDTKTAEPMFYGIPATVRRNAFLYGRVAIPDIAAMLKRTPRADRKKHEAKELSFETRPHGKSGEGPVRRKLQLGLSLGRLSRPQRVRLLAQKCRAAGVTNACALALAK